MNRMSQQPVVLLTEVDPLIGVDLSDALEKAGYRVLGPVGAMAEALRHLEQDKPTLAIIDVLLKDGCCTALARELRQRGVPFLVHSDFRQDQRLNGEFQDVLWLSKPASPEDMVALCGELSLAVSAPAPEVPSSKPAAPIRLVHRTTGTSNPFARKLEGFVALTDADRALLEQISASPRIVQPHTDLVREGDKPDGVFLIMGGFACRHKLRASGARQIMAYLLPGDLCDLDVALLDTMDHTLTTLSVCRVVHIAPETVAQLMEHPQIARALRMSTLVDEATLREWLVNVGRRSADERIAHLFCELLLRLQAVGLATENSYELPLTQVDLADTTGLTNVHVNRTLQSLRRQGLIELQGRRLTILNPPRLRALAEFKPNYLHLGDRAAA
ncbi:helix-turn-helix domain-containing protein [Methylobacterium oxalidis]|uniref:helix-turn-helix domain-containing protein n=1 Tax=Methylobacterium oxalidis TaxID=944322 RepID=UPI0033156509